MRSANPARTKLVCLIVAATVALLVAPAQAKNVLKATILHMNDVHGHYAPYREGDPEQLVGGYGKAALLIDKIREEDKALGRETYVLMAGDLLTGTPLDAITKGTLGVKLMNLMGFTAMAVGNHEFDLGWKQLFEVLAPMMQFPLLSANIRTSATPPPPIQASVELPTTSGTRVVVFGLTTEDTKTKTKPSNVEGIEFLDEFDTAAKFLTNYKDEDFVIALTHMGLTRDIKLAGLSPKIDVIVGGHSHSDASHRGGVNQAVVVQAAACARYLGKLDMEVVDGKVVSYCWQLIPLDGTVPEAARIKDVIDEAKKALPEAHGEVIGRTEISLVGGCRASVFAPAERLDKLVTFVISQGTGTPALMNAGTVRSCFNKGEITIGDVETALPFKGSIPVTVQLTGAELAAALQQSANESDYGAKLRSVGIAYQVDKGNVTVERVGDAEFDPQQTYKIAINDFLAQGGDGYAIFKDKPSENGPKLIKDMVIDFIKKQEVITAGFVQGIR